VTPYLDFKVKIFFNVKYLRNGTRYNYICNGRLKGSPMVYRVAPFSVTLNDPWSRLFDVIYLGDDTRWGRSYRGPWNAIELVCRIYRILQFTMSFTDLFSRSRYFSNLY